MNVTEYEPVFSLETAEAAASAGLTAEVAELTARLRQLEAKFRTLGKGGEDLK